MNAVMSNDFDAFDVGAAGVSPLPSDWCKLPLPPSFLWGLEGFFSVGRLKLSSDRCVFVLRTHSECSAAFPAAGHSSYFSSRPDVAVIYRRSSSAVGSSNGREPKSASEKYDQPAELRLNVDSNQLQLLMFQSKGFFNIFSPPLPFHLCWVLM